MAKIDEFTRELDALRDKYKPDGLIVMISFKITPDVVDEACLVKGEPVITESLLRASINKSENLRYLLTKILSVGQSKKRNEN